MQAQTLNISLPKSLIKKVDIIARQEYRNRSELIREALRVYLQDKKEWQQIFKAGEKSMKQMGVKSEADVNEIVSKYRHGRTSS